jgi:hypothetical protein
MIISAISVGSASNDNNEQSSGKGLGDSEDNEEGYLKQVAYE